MTDNAVIVDIDGTLAEFDPNHVGAWVLGTEKQWGPFFTHMAEAQAIEPVVRLVRLLEAQGQRIVICSGRPDGYREHTRRWLVKREIPFHGLYLRDQGDDHLADEVVKSLLLERMRRDGFFPWLVLDDRDAVVDQWRRLGLTCLQCAEGDF